MSCFFPTVESFETWWLSCTQGTKGSADVQSHKEYPAGSE